MVQIPVSMYQQVVGNITAQIIGDGSPQSHKSDDVPASTETVEIMATDSQ